MIKKHRTLDDFSSGPMKKNERWMKIIQRSKKKTQRSPNFYQLFGFQADSLGPFYSAPIFYPPR
jgi:hypothetical protein